MAYIDTGFKNTRPSTTDWFCNLRQTQMDDEVKKYPNPVGPLKRSHLQQLLTDNVFNYDVENHKCSDKRRRKRTNAVGRTRGTDDLLYIDVHILKEIKTKGENVANAWL